MTISGWIENREMTGFPTFSYQEVSNAFPTLSSNVVSNKLCLLGKQKRIQTVHKQFYTVVPIQFKDRGIVPPYNYVDQLMTYLRRPYYISLLSAGVLHGAAHQRPQRLAIMTVPPRISFSKNSNHSLQWCYRQEIPKELLETTHSDTGVILYSNAELTVIDLVQYAHLVGGLSAATTVIAELIEKTDFLKQSDLLIEATTYPTLQRLGYILDVVLDEQEQAAVIEGLLQPHYKELKFRPLSSDHSEDQAERNKRWKLIINHEIAPDEW
jgi:predicted transcriptional regulator of viral defense system